MRIAHRPRDVPLQGDHSNDASRIRDQPDRAGHEPGGIREAPKSLADALQLLAALVRPRTFSVPRSGDARKTTRQILPAHKNRCKSQVPKRDTVVKVARARMQSSYAPSKTIQQELGSTRGDSDAVGLHSSTGGGGARRNHGRSHSDRRL